MPKPMIRRPRHQRPQINALFDAARAAPNDNNEHLDYLMRLASTVHHVTELGVATGRSTTAFLMAEPDALVSVDQVIRPELAPLRAACDAELITEWQLVEADSRTVDLASTDLLFIDTGHYFDVMEAELRRHASRVRRYLVMHDTVTYSEQAPEEPHREGIWRAISAFARRYTEWSLLAHSPHQHGLTVFARHWQNNSRSA